MKTTALIAQATNTGLFFNGIAFEETNAHKARTFPPTTTADDFKLTWACPVEMVPAPASNQQKPSLALRIHRGEFDKYGAVREYIRENGRTTKSGWTHCSFSIRVADGKYVSRKIKVPAKSHDSCFIKFYNNEVAVVWSKGELATDW